MKHKKYLIPFLILVLLLASSVSSFAETFNYNSVRLVTLNDLNGGTYNIVVDRLGNTSSYFYGSVLNINGTSLLDGVGTSLRTKYVISNISGGSTIEEIYTNADPEIKWYQVKQQAGFNSCSYTITLDPSVNSVVLCFDSFNVNVSIESVAIYPEQVANLSISGNVLTWDSALNADSYQVQYSSSVANLAQTRVFSSSSNSYSLSNIGFYRVRGYNDNGYGEWSNWASYNPSGTVLSTPSFTIVPQYNNVYRIGYVDNASAYRVYCNGYAYRVIQPSEFLGNGNNRYYDIAFLSNGNYSVQALGNGSTYADSLISTSYYFNTAYNVNLPTVPTEYEYDTDKSWQDNIFGLLKSIAESIENLFSTSLYYLNLLFSDITLWINNILTYVNEFIGYVPNILGFLPDDLRKSFVAFIGLGMFIAVWRLFKK